MINESLSGSDHLSHSLKFYQTKLIDTLDKEKPVFYYSFQCIFHFPKYLQTLIICSVCQRINKCKDMCIKCPHEN